MNDDYSSRSDREGRFGPGLLLWMFVVGLLLAMTATFFWNNSYEHILISDLLRLVEATQLDEKHQLTSSSPGYIDVYSSNVEDGFVRYSGLTGVIMSKTEIRGEVTKQFFKPVEATTKQETATETTKSDKSDSAKADSSPVEATNALQADAVKSDSVKSDSVSGDAEKVAATTTDTKAIATTEVPTEPKTEKIYFITRLHESDAETVAKLLKEHGIVRRNAEPNFWTDYAPWIMLMMLLTLFAIMLLRKIGAAGNPMAFGRSRGKLYAMEELGITFNDVAGIDEAVEEVKEIVDFLRNAEKYQSLGGRIPKGVLLVGPPGTGKTLLAKAIAGEAGVPFFSLSGSDFVEMFVGVGAARVRDMFLQAEDKAPCIIFIDELDALGKSRGSGLVGGHDEREQTLNALLVEMDGFGSNSGVIVMAATNRPETLDPALLRPGRFDRHVLVDRPDIRGREAILKVHVKNVKLDPVVDLKRIASITPGFVGADLANLVNEAALLAARKGKTAVGMDEFNEGVERVQIGLEKKQRVMNDDEKLRVAYHESGHAVVAFSLPNTDPVHKVSIIPRGIGALGYVLRRPEGDRFLRTQQELESNIQVALAGTLAEEIFLGDVSTGNQSDLEHSTEIARGMVMEYGMSQLGRINYREKSSSIFLAGAGEDRPRSHSEATARQIDVEVQRIVNEALERTRHIIETRRDAVEALARKLMVVESVDSEELKKIIDANTKGPLVVPGTDVAPKASNLLSPNGDAGPLTAEGRS